MPSFKGPHKEPRELGSDLLSALADALAHNKAFLDDVHQAKPLFFRGTVTALQTTGSPPNQVRQVQVQRTGQASSDGYWYPVYDAGYSPSVGDDVLLCYTDRRMSACVIGARTAPAASGALLSLDAPVTALADPVGWPTLAATNPSPATSLAAGTYAVGYCYTTAEGGRTRLSKTAPITITTGQGISATAPALPAGASGVEFYIDDCAPQGPGDSIAGGGTYGAFTSQGIAGGGAYGTFSSQSIGGGGSVSSVTIEISDNHDTPAYTYAGFFFKIASLPASDMTLLDFNGGTTAYIRIKLTAAGHVVLECSHRGATMAVDLNPSLATGVWYWCALNVGSYAGSTYALQEYAGLQVVAAGGATTSGSASTGNMSGVGSVRETISCTLGWGVSQSSSYLSNASANELTKLEWGIATSTNANSASLLLPPSTDPAAGSLSGLYLCRDALGSSTCTDSTSNAAHLSAGPNGMTVVAAGPYP